MGRGFREAIGYVTRSRALVLVTMGGGLLFFTPIKFIGLLLLLAIGARYLRVWFGPITSFIMSYVFFAGSLAIISIPLWQFSIPLRPDFVGIGWCAILILLGYNQRKKDFNQVRKSSNKLLAKDLAALTLSLVVCMVILWPILSKANATTLSRALMGGGDNTAHLQIVKSIDKNHGAVYGQRNAYNAPLQESIYPQGWHVNVAFVKWLIDPLANFGYQTSLLVVIFYSVALFWFGIFIYLLVVVALYALPVNSLKAYLTAMTVVGIGIAGWLITMFAYGHQAHIAIHVFLLGAILWLTTALRNKQNKAVFVPAILLAGAAFLSYYFGAITIALSMIACYTFVKLYTRTKVTFWEIISGIIVGYVCVVQFGIRYSFAFLFKDTGESIYQVSGLVAKSSFSILFVLYLLALGIFLFYRNNRTLQLITVITGINILFSAILSILYFKHHIPPGYYIFKVNLSAMISLIIMYAILLPEAVHDLTARLKGKWLASIFLVVVLGASWYGGYLLETPMLKGYIQATNFGADARVTSKVLGLLNANPADGDRIIVFGSCNRAEDIRATAFARSLAVSKHDFDVYPPGAMGFNDKYTLFADMQTYYAIFKQPMIFVANDRKLATELQAYLDEHKTVYTIHILDPDMFQESPSQCPERVRDIANEKI